MRLWDPASGHELRRFEGHSDTVTSVAWSPDGTRIASGYEDKILRLWDVASGREIQHFMGHGDKVTSVAWSPDGTRIASGSEDSTVRLWDAASGRELHSFAGHGNGVTSVAWSRDGIRLASGSWDMTVRLWDVASGHELRSFDGQGSEVGSVAWSPDGTRIAVGLADQTMRLWDAASGRELRRFEGHGGPLTSVVWSPDGLTLATGSWDETVRLWDTASGRELRRFDGHQGVVSSVAWSPDGTRVASGSWDRTIRLWDTASGRELRRFDGHGWAVTSVAWSPDGALLATGSGDNTVRLWEVASGRELRRFETRRGAYSVAWSPDGTLIAAGCSDNLTRLWDVTSGHELRPFKSEVDGTVFSVAWSPGGSRVATGSWDDMVRLWDVASHRELHHFRHYGGVRSIAWSPDGNRLASGSKDNTVGIWDAASGKELWQLVGGPSGRWLACKLEDSGSRRCWRHDDGRLLQRVKADGQLVPVPPPQSSAPTWQFDSLPKGPLAVALGEASRVTVTVRNTGQGPGFWGQLVATPVDFVGPPAVRLLNTDDEPLLRLDPGETKPVSLALIGISRQENPLSGSVDLDLSLVHAFGTEPIGRVTARVAAPELRIAAAGLDARDQRTLTLSLVNAGEQAAPGLVGEAVLRGVDANTTWEKSFEQRIDRPDPIPPGATVQLALPLPKAVQKPDRPFQVQVTLLGVAPPLYRWRLEAPVVVPGWPLAYYAALAAALLLLTTLAYWAAVLRYPVLVAVSRRPGALLEVAPEMLGALNRRLIWAFRRRGVLARAEVPEPRFRRATGFAGLGPEAQVRLLVERLELKLEHDEALVPAHGVRLWSALTPGHLPLNLPRLRLAFPPPGLPREEVLAALRADENGRGVVALVIAADPEQRQALRASALDPDAMVAVPDGAGLTALLLDPAPVAVLARLISEDVRVTHVSLYKLGHGVNKTSGFFGRDRELAHILNRELGNYFLIAGRQIGKTSLMQEIGWRCQRLPGLDARYCSLSDADSVAPLAGALGLAADAGAAAVLAALPAAPGTRRLMLIDEADAFVTAEIGRGFPLLSAFRTLSAEGRVHFILAGFWDLYRAVGLDYLSPLRNFGEEMRLGPLEREAALALATQPMAALNLRYADPALPERIYERTGGRANLIAIVCDRLLAGLDPRARVIDAAAVEVALRRDEVFSALRGWDGLSGDGSDQARADNGLDRQIVLATVAEGRFTAADLQRRLAELGSPQGVPEIDRALQRLQIAAIVRRDADGVYGYAVPLFVEMLKAFDLR